MSVGREEVRKGLAFLERLAVANEELIALAKDERVEDAKLPDPGFCPHCNTMNPMIRNESGQDNLDHFVLVAECENCHSRFFAFPLGWQIVKTADEARDILKGRNG